MSKAANMEAMPMKIWRRVCHYATQNLSHLTDGVFSKMSSRTDTRHRLQVRKRPLRNVVSTYRLPNPNATLLGCIGGSGTSHLSGTNLSGSEYSFGFRSIALGGDHGLAIQSHSEEKGRSSLPYVCENRGPGRYEVTIIDVIRLRAVRKGLWTLTMWDHAIMLSG